MAASHDLLHEHLRRRLRVVARALPHHLLHLAVGVHLVLELADVPLHVARGDARLVHLAHGVHPNAAECVRLCGREPANFLGEMLANQLEVKSSQGVVRWKCPHDNSCRSSRTPRRRSGRSPRSSRSSRRSCYDAEDRRRRAVGVEMDCHANALGSGFGDEGAARIAAELGSATHLDLRGKAISDAGASSLAAALETNATVHTLWLWNNSVGEAGVVVLHLCRKHSAGQRGPRGSWLAEACSTWCHPRHPLAPIKLARRHSGRTCWALFSIPHRRSRARSNATARSPRSTSARTRLTVTLLLGPCRRCSGET